MEMNSNVCMNAQEYIISALESDRYSSSLEAICDYGVCKIGNKNEDLNYTLSLLNECFILRQLEKVKCIGILFTHLQ